MNVLVTVLMILGTTAFAQVCDPACGSNAECTTADATDMCVCSTGYAGDGTSCEDIDECATATNNCDTNAECTNTEGSFACACNSGYTGDGVACVDIDECIEINLCHYDAYCTNTDGSYVCGCRSGYHGDGVSCEDSDECIDHTDDCEENAACTNTVGSYTCACNSGYNSDGRTCVDIDECATDADNCDRNATCTNTAGLFTCDCNSGYSGDGITCVDIDECFTGIIFIDYHNCHADAVCTNNDGSFTCACNPGYNGDGITCEDIDECATNTDNCAANATCTNTAGSFTCTCNSGYSGDGVTCGFYCYVCSDHDFDGDGEVYDHCSKDVASLATTACYDNAGLEYCKTTFTIEDGVPTAILRTCESTGSDTKTVPSDHCTTAISPFRDPTSTSMCEYTCTTSHCNSQTAASLQVCSINCGSNGRCNYLTGTCACDSGWSGSDCSTEGTAPRHKCVQCSTDIDSTCSSTTAASVCPRFQQYCSTTSSIVYDRSENIINAITLRGCTDVFVAVDECAFTNIYTDDGIINADLGYKEFTCYSTCATDGCNTNTANGVVDGSEFAGLHCVQCIDTDGYGPCTTLTAREVCPAGTTHCKSTVTYLISEITDRPYVGADPAYQLRSVVRECATAAVTASCSETSVAGISGMKKVTCTETCTEDGCNTGWPARPSCIQCVTTQDGYDECLENPPQSTGCAFPYQKYCTIKERGTEQLTGYAIQGYPHIIQRDCSHWDIGTGCSTVTPRDINIEICNRTCTTDGCNVGVARNGSEMLLRSMFAVVAQVAP